LLSLLGREFNLLDCVARLGEMQKFSGPSQA
jgi:hypothetical protein